jgi:hypothetical protein
VDVMGRMDPPSQRILDVQVRYSGCSHQGSGCSLREAQPPTSDVTVSSTYAGTYVCA